MIVYAPHGIQINSVAYCVFAVATVASWVLILYSVALDPVELKKKRWLCGDILGIFKAREKR
jgi:hypothetical protein